MTDLVQLALSLCATAGTAAEVVKKHIFHGHPLDRARLRRLIALAEALALVNRAWHRSNPSIHYDGCWRDHLACAVAEVERLTKLLEAKA